LLWTGGVGFVTTALIPALRRMRDPAQAFAMFRSVFGRCSRYCRAVHFGARVLILDEPTSALGVRQTANVLATVSAVRRRGSGIVLVTHNMRHATAIGDRFTVLNHGRILGTALRGEISQEELQNMMAGGQELVQLEESLQA
jgi:simple sugar transport system ATP-binding protein